MAEMPLSSTEIWKYPPLTKLMRTLSISVAPPPGEGIVTRDGVSPDVATIPVSACCAEASVGKTAIAAAVIRRCFIGTSPR